jgi:hypothetical protein
MNEESLRPARARRNNSIGNHSTHSAPGRVREAERSPLTRRKLKGTPVSMCSPKRNLDDNSNYATTTPRTTTPRMKLNMSCPTRKKSFPSTPDSSKRNNKGVKSFLKDRVSSIIGKEDAMALLLTREFNSMEF